MGTTALVSVEQYLATSYSDGDLEYLDGSTRLTGEVYTAIGSYTATDGVLRTENPVIEVPLATLFKKIPTA